MSRLLWPVAAFAVLVAGCSAPPLKVGSPPPSDPPTDWPFQANAIDGSRAAGEPGFGEDDLGGLGVAWSFTTRGAVTGTPTVADGRVHVATWKGMVYALDAATGQELWSRDLGAQMDASVTLFGGKAAIGDAAGRLHVLDAATGATLWDRLVDPTLHAHLYATPLAIPWPDGDRLIQAVASDQESARIHGDAPIDFRGHVVAYSAENGTELWRSYLVDEGMTGAPVWGTPVFHEPSGFILFGTGNAYTDPAGPLTDAIVALRAEDGSVAWSHQALAGDVFTQLNPINPDDDFGATPALATADGVDLVGLGQKSSIFWALDAVTGRVAWASGKSGPGEGIIGDAAVSSRGFVVPYVTQQRVALLDQANGTERWSHALDGVGFPDPVAVGNIAFVADGAGNVKALRLADGTVAWNASVEGGVFGGLSVAAGHLFVPVVRDGFLGEEGAVVAFAPAAQGDGGGGDGGPSGANTVAMRGYAFEPATITVKAGTTVSWRNEDPQWHTATDAGGAFDVGVDPGTTGTFRFDAPGTYTYYCKPHAARDDAGAWQGMVATVVVEP